MKTHRAYKIQSRFFAYTLAIFLCLAGTGCQKESEAIVSIALHPTNANILYVATNDAVYKSRDEGLLWERFPSFSARRAECEGVWHDYGLIRGWFAPLIGRMRK